MPKEPLHWIRWPAVLIALGVALAICYRASGLAREPYLGLSPRGDRVGIVYSGGPADRAGLERGDRILAVNARPLSAAADLHTLLRSGGTQRVILLTVERDGEHLAVELFPEPLPQPELFWLLAHALVAGATLLVGTVVFFRRTGRLTATFFGLCLALATSLFRPHAIPTSWGYPIDALAGEILSTLLPAILLHFFLLFPYERAAILRNPSLQIVPYLPGLLFLLISRLGRHLGQPQRVEPRDVELAASVAPGLYTLTALVLAVILFATAYRRSPLPTVRRKLKVTLVGTLCGLVPLFLVVILRTAAPSVPVPGDRLATLAVFLLPASFGYAIVRHGIFEAELFIKRTLVYAGIAAVAVLAYLALSFSLQHLLRQAPDGLADRLAAISALAVIVLLVSPLRGRMQEQLDRWIYPDRYDTARALRELGRELAEAADQDEVARILLQSLRRGLGVERAAFFVPVPSTDTLRLHARLERDGVEVLAPDDPSARVGRLFSETLYAIGHPALRGDFEAELPYGWLPRADLAVLKDLAVRVLVPLAAGERRFGLLLIGPRTFAERFSPPDLELLEGVQARAVLALENTLYLREREERAGLERELELASSLQQQLLPRRLPVLTRFDLAAGTIPCREVGGDFYDCLETGTDQVTLAIGDVSGKGVPAALLMANLQATFRAELAAGGPPSAITARVNHRLCALESPTRIVSFFCGRLHLEDNRFTYTNAGHLHPMLVRRDGVVERLDRGGLILGIFEESGYDGGEVRLDPGDLLVFFTDGVIERGGPQELFGEEDLQEVVSRHRHLSASDLMGRILEALEHRTGNVPDDDTTLMVLKAL